MLKNKLGGLLVAGAVAMTLAACTESSAKVLEAEAITKVVKVPREECSDKVVTRQKPVKDEHRVLGTVAGAIIGGVVGNEIGGKGTSQDVATIGGAAAGGYAGNRIQKSVQQKSTVQTTEQSCRQVFDSQTVETGTYRVRYELNGKVGTVTMDRNPGASIPVREGKLVL